jgi:Co/Zn/Cd efflux system component
MSMTDTYSGTHFLGEGHEKNERRTWLVIWLCGAMMIAEIVGGLLFGSIALVADGLHMSTHAGALLLAALAYTYARKRAGDPNFTFGTGKFGDLAGFTPSNDCIAHRLRIRQPSVCARRYPLCRSDPDRLSRL